MSVKVVTILFSTAVLGHAVTAFRTKVSAAASPGLLIKMSNTIKKSAQHEQTNRFFIAILLSRSVIRGSLSIYPVFFRELNHCHQVLRSHFVYRTSRGHDETTVVTHLIDEFLAIILHLLQRAYLKQ